MADTGQQWLVTRSFRWLRGTPNRTFVLYPVTVLLTHRRIERPHFLPLLVWGYLQYRLIGEHRQRQRAGGRGFDRPPARLLTTGPYALSRNPMYLGHIIFMIGLALSTGSRLAWPSSLPTCPGSRAACCMTNSACGRNSAPSTRPTAAACGAGCSASAQRPSWPGWSMTHSKPCSRSACS